MNPMGELNSQCTSSLSYWEGTTQAAEQAMMEGWKDLCVAEDEY